MCNFHRLDVIAWLADPKKRDQVEEVLSRHVTDLRFTRRTSILNEHGLIQLCLLGTELFQFDGAFTPDEPTRSWTYAHTSYAAHLHEIVPSSLTPLRCSSLHTTAIALIRG